MNGSHIAIPTILKVGKGTLKDIGSYIKDSRIENAVVYFGNGLIDLFGDTVLQSFHYLYPIKWIDKDNKLL